MCIELVLWKHGIVHACTVTPEDSQLDVPATCVLSTMEVLEVFWWLSELCFEYLFLNPGLVLVHVAGFVLWSRVNDVTVPARAAVTPLVAAETALAAAWGCGCLGVIWAVPVGALCLAGLAFWTGLGTVVIRDDATFVAGKSRLLSQTLELTRVRAACVAQELVRHGDP